MARPSYSKEQIEAERRRVVHAAEHLFAERGYEGVTLRALAEALGRSPAAAYRYFDGKAAIFVAARIAAYERFAETQEQVVRETSDPVERLSRIGDAYVAFALAEPDAYRLMFEMKPPASGLTPELRAAEDRAWAPLRSTIGAAVEDGSIAADAPDVLAHLFWSALHGVVSLHLAGKLSHGQNLEALHEPMKRLLFAGVMGARSGRSPVS